MNNCVLADKCSRTACDKSCPAYTEIDYLLSRNNIPLSSKVYNADFKIIGKYNDILDWHTNDTATVFVRNDAMSSTINAAQLMTFVGICKHWKGNCLHCSVYHLKFSTYLDDIQRSWSSRDNAESLEYQTIWVRTAKVLIISNLDFISFKDFQAQTLLNLIHERNSQGLSTIIISPPVGDLLGDMSSPFFKRLREVLSTTKDTGEVPR